MSRRAQGETDLTREEQAHARAALRFLRLRLGSWESLSKALKFRRETIRDVQSGGTVTARLAFRIARLAGAPIDDVIAGRFPPKGTCPYCGHVDLDIAASADRIDHR